jgi:hypothetical protein
VTSFGLFIFENDVNVLLQLHLGGEAKIFAKYMTAYEDQNLQSSIAYLLHFGMDPDPRIHASD